MVPREVSVQDFQETDLRAGVSDSGPKMRAVVGDAGYERLGEEGRRAMWRADPIFIDAAFDSIIQHYGSVDNYLEKRLDITAHDRSEEHTSELQSLMRSSYAVLCLKKKKTASCTRLQTRQEYNIC